MLPFEMRKGKFFTGSYPQIPALTFLVLMLSGLCCPEPRAQQLDAKIELFTELLPSNKQEKLENLAENLENYFYDYEWIEDFSGPAIPFSFRMYLVDESTGFEDRYGARIHASNDYDLQYLDKDCHFAYWPDESLEHDAVIYHSLTGLLDYFAYLIIGGEMDKRSTLGGDPHFRSALDIVQKALFSEHYRGWNRRKEWVEIILAEENLEYRKMLAVYFRALEHWKDEEVEKARRLGCSALAMIEEILNPGEGDEELPREQEEQIARFFTHHYLEMTDLFKEDPQGHEVFHMLIALDPEHQEIYARYLED
ncbi:MAG: hypothetical protein AMJ92_05675 [candidate division Zixibacteria bacterium SM23_81]|nr:MAG: hypothetical protein AMJ92_05675 [candidate division Zixibacteria bacterium SM23_81]